MSKILIDETTARQVLEALNSFPHRHLTPFISDTRTALREALAQQEPLNIAALVEGMEVSIDVSTGDHDSGNRLFGDVTLVQENQGSKHGLILLVQEPEANFKKAAQQPAQQQEPVAWIWKYANGEEEVVFVPPRHVDATHIDAPSTITPLYTFPPARFPLTNEEIENILPDDDTPMTLGEAFVKFARAIEAAHGIKGGT